VGQTQGAPTRTAPVVRGLSRAVDHQKNRGSPVRCPGAITQAEMRRVSH
jgi:hypothetical protein